MIILTITEILAMIQNKINNGLSCVEGKEYLTPLCCSEPGMVGAGEQSVKEGVPERHYQLRRPLFGGK